MENEKSPKSQSGDKKQAKYYCKRCDFGTDNKKDFKRHTESKKHEGNGGKPLIEKEDRTAETKAFFCITCYYGTDNRKDYKRHLDSIKHMKAEDEEDRQVKEMVEKLRLKQQQKEREEAEYIESITAKCIRGCRYKRGEKGWDFDGLKGNWLCNKCDEEECKMLFGLRNTIVA